MQLSHTWAILTLGYKIGTWLRDKRSPRKTWRDFGAIVIATLASFLGGEVFNAYNWFGLLG